VCFHAEPGYRPPAHVKVWVRNRASGQDLQRVTELGFSLLAATTVGAGDRPGRLALCKYVLRPPIAQERALVQKHTGDL
jgi:hypothetical protein